MGQSWTLKPACSAYYVFVLIRSYWRGRHCYFRSISACSFPVKRTLVWNSSIFSVYSFKIVFSYEEKQKTILNDWKLNSCIRLYDALRDIYDWFQ